MLPVVESSVITGFDMARGPDCTRQIRVERLPDGGMHIRELDGSDLEGPIQIVGAVTLGHFRMPNPVLRRTEDSIEIRIPVLPLIGIATGGPGADPNPPPVLAAGVVSGDVDVVANALWNRETPEPGPIDPNAIASQTHGEMIRTSASAGQEMMSPRDQQEEVYRRHGGSRNRADEEVGRAAFASVDEARAQVRRLMGREPETPAGITPQFLALRDALEDFLPWPGRVFNPDTDVTTEGLLALAREAGLESVTLQLLEDPDQIRAFRDWVHVRTTAAAERRREGESHSANEPLEIPIEITQQAMRPIFERAIASVEGELAQIGEDARGGASGSFIATHLEDLRPKIEHFAETTTRSRSETEAVVRHLLETFGRTMDDEQVWGLLLRCEEASGAGNISLATVVGTICTIGRRRLSHDATVNADVLFRHAPDSVAASNQEWAHEMAHRILADANRHEADLPPLEEAIRNPRAPGSDLPDLESLTEALAQANNVEPLVIEAATTAFIDALRGTPYVADIAAVHAFCGDLAEIRGCSYEAAAREAAGAIVSPESDTLGARRVVEELYRRRPPSQLEAFDALEAAIVDGDATATGYPDFIRWRRRLGVVCQDLNVPFDRALEKARELVVAGCPPTEALSVIRTAIERKQDGFCPAYQIGTWRESSPVTWCRFGQHGPTRHGSPHERPGLAWVEPFVSTRETSPTAAEDGREVLAEPPDWWTAEMCARRRS